MMTRFNDIWTALTEDASGEAEGWLLRRLRPEPTCVISLGLQPGTAARAVTIRVDRADVPKEATWPVSAGLKLFALTPAGPRAERVEFGVMLADARCGDVFEVFAADLVERLERTGDSASRVSTLLGRIDLWRRFFAALREGLGPDQVRGLFGEVHFLLEVLLPVLVSRDAVTGWTGPLGATQDFQFPWAAIEVKTTQAGEPQVVRINGERQLDETGSRALFLFVLSLDERAGAADPSRPHSRSLPESVVEARGRLANDPAAQGLFNDRLLSAGYLDAHESRYSGTQFTIRGQHAYRVRDDFPRLTEPRLPVGVGGVAYSLALAACAPFEVDSAEITTLCSPAPDRATAPNEDGKQETDNVHS